MKKFHLLLSLSVMYLSVSAQTTDPVPTIDQVRINLYYPLNPAGRTLVDGLLTEYGDTSLENSTYGKSYIDAINIADAYKFYNILESFGIMRHGIFLAVERRAFIGSEIGQFDTSFLRIHKLDRLGRRLYDFEFIIDVERHAKRGVLQDLFLNTETELDLKGTTRISFTTHPDSPGSANPYRFRLVFAAKDKIVPVLIRPTTMAVKVLPNPISSGSPISLQFKKDYGQSFASVMDLSGRLFYQTTIVAEGIKSLSVPRLLPGFYVVSVRNKQGESISTKITIAQ